MSTKTVWITAFDKEQDGARVGLLSGLLKRYGLSTQGSFWVDEPDKLAWRAGLDALNAARADLWLILANPDALAKPSIRYGLSLFAASLREARGAGFPMVLSGAAGVESMPALLGGATVLVENHPSWPAKIVARANLAKAGEPQDYRFEVVGEEQLGQWFAIGPREGHWDGVVFGVHGGVKGGDKGSDKGSEAKIDFQAIGPRGKLPEKTVLEYAQEGLTLQVGEREFGAWAVRNRLGPDDMYYARVRGAPESVLFMPYTDDSEASATILHLR
ncbi:hypothetical protein [Caballeronia insecticola]|uniref:Uncharacterized protein n=1 Tax=Caballeronia insecticola TaxID=758793 RepID=R4WYH1_9BURK|nr:hypothetical protein [Caballeronia insecticola]BAN26545.1 putative uncharacterized protein [Caballeronia insecticola]